MKKIKEAYWPCLELGFADGTTRYVVQYIATPKLDEDRAKRRAEMIAEKFNLYFPSGTWLQLRHGEQDADVGGNTGSRFRPEAVISVVPFAGEENWITRPHFAY